MPALLATPWTWDDRGLLAGSHPPTMQALATAWTQDFWSLAPPQSQHASGMFRPVTHTTFIVERALWGERPGLSHAVNGLLHLAVAWAAGALAGALGGSALLAGGIVLLHPHAAEALGTVAGRSDPLAALGILGALLLLRARAPGREPGPTTLVAGALCVSLACLSKEVGFVAPLLLLVIDLSRGRVRWASLAASGAGAGLALGVRLLALGGPLGERAPGGGFDPLGALASTGWALVDSTIPWPAGPWPAPHALVPGLVALAALVAVALAAPRRWDLGLGLLVGWVAIAWAPMADWAGIGVRSSRALLYVPILGVALWCARLPTLRALPSGPPWARLVAVTLALVLGGHQWTGVRAWVDERSLWEGVVLERPAEPLPWLNLAHLRRAAGDDEGAQEAYMRCAALAHAQREATWFVPAATALGQMAHERGDRAAAATYYADAVSAAGPAHAPEAQRALEALTTE